MWYVASCTSMDATTAANAKESSWGSGGKNEPEHALEESQLIDAALNTPYDLVEHALEAFDHKVHAISFCQNSDCV